ncbi:MAG: hypothetical protein GX442_11305 [Candidatus Riflebacteria bacterium]|nr:hypothetical protein [Candidatus Riflebacteria bacterium]
MVDPDLFDLLASDDPAVLDRGIDALAGYTPESQEEAQLLVNLLVPAFKSADPVRLTRANEVFARFKKLFSGVEYPRELMDSSAAIRRLKGMAARSPAGLPVTAGSPAAASPLSATGSPSPTGPMTTVSAPPTADRPATASAPGNHAAQATALPQAPPTFSTGPDPRVAVQSRPSSIRLAIRVPRLGPLAWLVVLGLLAAGAWWWARHAGPALEDLAREEILKELDAPATAQFRRSERIPRDNGQVEIQWEFDFQNPFGVMVRDRFRVLFSPEGQPLVCERLKAVHHAGPRPAP